MTRGTRATSRISWSRRLALGAAAASAIALPALETGAQSADQTIENIWLLACQGVDAEKLEERRRAGHACAEALEAAFGRGDIRLINLYQRIADDIAGGRGGAAIAASLPFRQRAYYTASRALGAKATTTGKTALAFAKALILAGRCSQFDRRVYTLLDAAARGFDGSPEGSHIRLEGRRQVALAYADSLDYRSAVKAMLGASASPRRDLTAQDWRRVGDWLSRVGDFANAADAYGAALAQEKDPIVRPLLEQDLRRMLFASGDLDRLRRFGK